MIIARVKLLKYIGDKMRKIPYPTIYELIELLPDMEESSTIIEAVITGDEDEQG